MSDAASSSAGDINITVKGPSELKLALTINPSKTVADLKELIASQSDAEKDRQRLIFSGTSCLLPGSGYP
ncbi:ubiquilin [Cryptococcus neoformans A5-35-17]|nr:ubiquilin [Cryptococcus neoformans var. grubii A5-35-17]